MINATGVVVHTNLGRAPLSDEALARVARGRARLLEPRVRPRGGDPRVAAGPRRGACSGQLTGAEAALVVNNNAAAVLLALAAARGGPRGGRLPRRARRDRRRLPHPGRPRALGRAPRRGRHDEPHARSTTTSARSARRPPRSCACTSRTSASSASPSRPALRELARLAERQGLVLVDDLGSGVLGELGDEPPVRGSLDAGAHLVTFSGDKLLGGPQAGIVVGRAELVERAAPPPAAARAPRRQAHARRARGDARALPRAARRASRCCACSTEPAGAVRARAERLAALDRRQRRGDSRPGRRRRASARRDRELRVRARGGARGAAARRRSRRSSASCATGGSSSTAARSPTTRSTEVAGAVAAHAAHGRHGRSHRPRQDVARPRADRQGHRPAARGAARGISIDLGYAPLELPDGRRLSLVDVPGHERFVRNMVAGATGSTSSCSSSTRPREHGRRRTSTWRSCVCSGSSTASSPSRRSTRSTPRRASSLSRRRASSSPGAAVVAVSARTGEGLDELRAALGARRDRVEQRRRRLPDPPVRRPRLHAPRHRHRGHRNALVGLDRRGRRAPRRAGRARRPRALASRCTTAGRARRGRPACRRRAPRRRARASSRAGTRSSSRDAYPVSYRLDVPSRSSTRSRTVRACTSTTGPRALRTRRPRGERYAQLRLASPAVAARGDRVVLRERTTLGGGARARPRAAAARRRGGSSCSSGATGRRRARRGEPVRASTSLRAPARRRARRGTRSRAGEWVVLDRLARGARADARRALEAARSRSIPGVPLRPPSRGRAAVLPLLGVERRGSKRLRAGRERQPRRPGARRRSGSRPSSTRPASSPSRSRTASSPASSRGRAPRPPRRRVRGRRRTPTTRARARRRGVRGRRIDHARALPRPRSAWAASTRSSCSSGSTRTASPAGSATSACCAAAPAARAAASRCGSGPARTRLPRRSARAR